MTKRIKVELLGAYPPPYGGVSVHVKRLKERLGKMGVSCKVYVYKGLSQEKDGIIRIKNRAYWFMGQLLSSKSDILHCHGYSPIALVFLSLLAVIRKRKIVMTTHGFLFSPKGVWFWHKMAFWLASKTSIYFIVTSPRVRERITGMGIKAENMNEDIIPAFIPPSKEEEESAHIPKYIWDFMEKHSPIIAANAYKIVFYNRQDLYGIDMCVGLCARLKKTYPNIGLVFCLPDVGNERYLEMIRNKIDKLKIADNFLFVTEPYQFFPILKKSQVFVRPTNVDDYGVSVAEAIHYGIPAVASDVCFRTEGTILFRNRNIYDFSGKVFKILGNYKNHEDSIKDIKLIDSAKEIYNVYRRLS